MSSQANSQAMQAKSTRVEDFECPSVSGWAALAVHLGCIAAALVLCVLTFSTVHFGLPITFAVLAMLILFVPLNGYTALEPNEAAVMLFAGAYKGTVTITGFRFVVPFYSCEKVSLRTCNFESSKLKVNDLDGNPIEIGAIVVWRVTSPASALLAVDDYGNFVKIQTESAVRTLANHYAYDSHDPNKASLREDPDKIAAELTAHIQERLSEAGVKIDEARISHLAYAQEIAQAMLQRQQASAIVAARFKIVEGAVGMVEQALQSLQEKNMVELDTERKAQMVSNLLVVLCSERSTTPVVNTGSVY